MKTWYLLEEIFGTNQDPHDQTMRIPRIIRTYISDTEHLPRLNGADDSATMFSRRVDGVEPVEAETWQDAKKKFKDLKLI